MLYSYLQQVQRLIFDYKQQLFRLDDLTAFINTARNQVAGESESIRCYASLSLSVNTTVYPFTSIANATGPVLNVRTMWYLVGDGQKWIRPRPFSWFSLYQLNNPVPGKGAPIVWSQFGQGVSGTIFIAPNPDIPYTLNLDTVVLPNALTTDATVETIPYPWTDAVPYFAAYLAFLSAQKPDMAKNMLDLYGVFTKRARSMSNASVLPENYEQSSSPTYDLSYGLQDKPPGQAQ